MKDYTKLLPKHTERYIGENDLFLEIYRGSEDNTRSNKRPPLLFIHGAYTGSWMWSKYIPHFAEEGFPCYVMNLRSHYKSRAMDLTKVSFEDYLEDVKTVIDECDGLPVIIGFSMGGILSQKIAETQEIAGMVLIDSSICRQVSEKVPYGSPEKSIAADIVPAPERSEISSIDESAEDIEFQKKYLSMESGKAFNACSIAFGVGDGISIDNSRITCPTLVIRTANNEEEKKRVKAEAEYFHGEYTGMKAATHTGLLVGQRYQEGIEVILNWLGRLPLEL